MVDKDRGLILNRPYEVPTRHWVQDHSTGYLKAESGRRPAQYRMMLTSKGSEKSTPQTGDEEHRLPGIAYMFEVVEILRRQMAEWRRDGYPGVSAVSRQLLQHWTYESRSKKLFFCQIEAMETFVYLAETTEGRKIAQTEMEGDGGPLERWCAKMATGTGKTVVMAMLIAWQTLNWHANSDRSIYSRSFIAVTPGLTVKDRLRVLLPEADGNYYDQFNLLPPGIFKDIISAHARVLVVNWHKLMWQTDEEIAKKGGVDKRGALSDKAWFHGISNRVLPTGETLNIINDEAHHAWRLPSDRTADDYNKRELKDATKWVEGLDRLHRAVGVARCYDFTATPFVPQGRKVSTLEQMFNWVVSDFGLNDAIESGLVKTPKIPTRDNTVAVENGSSQMPDSYLYHIYEAEEVKDGLKKADAVVRLPDKVIDAYRTLSSSWKDTHVKWKNSKVPPVMVSVANSTDTSSRIEHMFTVAKEIGVPELENPDTTLRIDSKVLKNAEKNGLVGKDKEKADRLREQVRTVGVANAAGGNLRHVISVEMLSEGWDAKNVTHIMGLRAFTSQLLCEQVIGRGLRRTDYQTDKDGYLRPDHVRIFGVPFVLMLQQEDKPGEDAKSPPEPPVDIYADHAKSNRKVWFPDVERIDQGEVESISIKLADISDLILDGDQVLTEASLSDAMPWLKAQSGETITSSTIENMRTQSLVFRAAAQISAATPELSHNQLFSKQIADLTAKFATSDKLKVVGTPEKKELVAKHRMYQIAEHVKNAVLSASDSLSSTQTVTPIYRDPHNPIRSTSEMMPWGTRAKKSKLYSDPKKCHLNIAICDTDLERKVARVLDLHKNVKAWVKNDREHTGFKVRYVHKGVTRDYIPDFIVHLEDSRSVIVEAKGSAEEEAPSKQRHLDWWVQAVNNEGRWGEWQNFGMVFKNDITRLKAMLDSG